MEKREFHPVASIFPLMPDAELQQLAEDIEVNGLREAIWVHKDGRIIDGQNRQTACEMVGVEPTYRVWDGDDDNLHDFVITENLHRRHLTPSQRAALAVKFEAEEKKAAKERQRLRDEKVSKNLDTIDYGRTDEKLAVKWGTTTPYIYYARQTRDRLYDIFKMLITAEKTIQQAKRMLDMLDKQDPKPLDGMYRVLYADPPWHYGNAGLDQYGPAERHYQTMTIDELSAMDVSEHVEDNAVLFLWVTSPLLDECWPVIKAWGFDYKTSFVWDKVKHNYGHYNSVRHELLLVCTRGSCTPDVSKLYDSVVECERTEKHSEKPEAFRGMIDTLYPSGRRCELFARRAVDGWERYGNEPD